ncbi:MAG: F0F1 ATP synthase subunit gamma [Lachnospiraceae bacterium]
MSIRNVVKVMNFHALIRVDKAKRQADKYKMMEEQLFAMMEAIYNNRNLILDKNIFQPDPAAPAIHIYIGSDFGFCSNYNSQMNDYISRDNTGAVKILIGRKLRSHGVDHVWKHISCSQLEDELEEIRDYLEEQITKRSCSAIELIYNHYENTTSIYSRKLKIYPISRESAAAEGSAEAAVYTEDFAIEGNINEIMVRLMAAYVYQELLLAVFNSRAAENIMRQNATTESLKKIDELEEEALMEERRAKRDKEFQKVVDNYVKKRMY